VLFRSPLSLTPPGLRARNAVFGATFFIRFGFGLTLAVFATYILGHMEGATSSAWAASIGVVGVISALAPIGEFSTVLFSGMGADRFGRIRVLLAGMIAAAVLLALASWTRDPVALGAINLGWGVAAGAILASSLAVIADQSGADERGFEMGRFDAVNLLGWIIGFAVGLFALSAVSNADLVWVFRVGAALVAAGVVVVLLMTRGYPEHGDIDAFRLARIRAAAFRGDVLLVTLPWLVIYLLIGTLLVFLGTASTSVGVPTYEIAIVIGVGGLLLLLTQPYFGRLADRHGRMRMMALGTAGFLGILLAASLIVAYGALPALLGLVGVSALAALAYGPAALAALTDLSKSISRATTMAIYSLTISLGMILGILGSSLLFDRFGSAGLYLFFGIVAVGLVVLTILRYRAVARGAVPA
jgi:MFS family permease